MGRYFYFYRWVAAARVAFARNAEMLQPELWARLQAEI
jgi:hypothetical protein